MAANGQQGKIEIGDVENVAETTCTTVDGCHIGSTTGDGDGNAVGD